MQSVGSLLLIETLGPKKPTRAITSCSLHCVSGTRALNVWSCVGEVCGISWSVDVYFSSYVVGLSISVVCLGRLVGSKEHEQSLVSSKMHASMRTDLITYISKH